MSEDRRESLKKLLDEGLIPVQEKLERIEALLLSLNEQKDKA